MTPNVTHIEDPSRAALRAGCQGISAINTIRSVIGVPLWKGEEILGVLQMDNRESTGVFTSADLDVCAVLAHHASLILNRSFP